MSNWQSSASPIYNVLTQAVRRFVDNPLNQGNPYLHFEEDQDVNLKNNSLNKSQRLPYEYDFGDTTDPEHRKRNKAKRRAPKKTKKRGKKRRRKQSMNPFKKELGEIENFNFKMKMENKSKKKKTNKDFDDVKGVEYNILEDLQTDENPGPSGGSLEVSNARGL